MEEMTKTETKRRPGRPPSEAKKNSIANKGLVEKSEDDKNRIELVLMFPSVFKKLFALYKATDVTDIIMEFETNYVNFYAIVRGEEGMISNTRLDCTNVYLYYCAKPTRIMMGRSNSEKIINRIDTKFYDSMKIAIKESSNQIESMEITLNNPNIGCVSHHTLGVTSLVDIEKIGDDKWDERSYSFGFTLPYREFKKYMSDIQSIGPADGKLQIQRVKDKPIHFIYKTEGHNIIVDETFNNNEIIKAKTQSTKNTVFGNTVCVGNLKRLSVTQVSEAIDMYVDVKLPIMCIFDMGDSMITKILVPIVNHTQ